MNTVLSFFMNTFGYFLLVKRMHYFISDEIDLTLRGRYTAICYLTSA